MFSSMLQHVVKFHFRKSIVWYVENVRWCIIYAFMFASHKFVMLEGARKHTYLIRVSAMTYYKIFNSAKNTKHKAYKVSRYLFFLTTFLYLHYNDIKRHAKRDLFRIIAIHSTYNCECVFCSKDLFLHRQINMRFGHDPNQP